MARSGNPALKAEIFTNAPRAVAGDGLMTINGTVNKTIVLLALALLTAGWAWSNYFGGNTGTVSTAMMAGVIGGLIVAFATIFKPTWSPITAPLYALLEGLVLGGASALFESRYPGIVLQAVGLTFATMLSMLITYRSGLIKVTDKFVRGVVIATGGILLFYVADMLLGFFGHSIPFIHQSSGLGIGFSLVVVGIAALNLLIDFEFIVQGARAGAPKYMEWYGSFSLMVTLVWLYLELLRLLAKIRD